MRSSPVRLILEAAGSHLRGGVKVSRSRVRSPPVFFPRPFFSIFVSLLLFFKLQ